MNWPRFRTVAASPFRSGPALRSSLAWRQAYRRTSPSRMESRMKSIASLAFLAAVSLHAPAAQAAADVPQQTPDSYAVAGERITVAPGRALNLRCVGDGPQTVLLE